MWPGRRPRRRPALLATPVGVASAVLIALLVGLAMVGPVLWADDASAVDTSALLQPPSRSHPFGTDELGRDIFWRVLVATRLSVALAALATALGFGIGVAVGALPTLLGRRAGRVLSAGINIAVAFPALLLVLFFAVVFGVGQRGAVLALGLASAPFYARMTHTLVASIGSRDFVAAARAAGVGRARLLSRHILPNVAEPLIINATVGAGNCLLAFSALSFLGLGIQAPAYDWGRLLNGGLIGIYQNPLGALAPAVAIVLAGLAFNLLGEAAAQVVGDPRVTPPPVAPSEHRAAGPVPPSRSVLLVRNLQVSIHGPRGWARAVRGVDLELRAGETVGLVGESGSGKTLTALALSDLLSPPAHATAERLEFQGIPVTEGSRKELRQILGLHLSMVFQDPIASFNPVQRLGAQLAELSRVHEGLGRRESLDKAVDRLRAVRIPNPARRARQYPHELSGGMRQRGMIAMGLMGQPRLIVADEPTTALDVTVQQQVLRLLSRTRAEHAAALMLISHDLTLVQQVCDRILVMYAGKVVEELTSGALYTSAQHPYTRALLGAVPGMDASRDLPLTVIPGRPPVPHDLPVGCAFADRCPMASGKCRAEDPPLRSVGPQQRVACWHPQGER